jgi:hypothetical protein
LANANTGPWRRRMKWLPWPTRSKDRDKTSDGPYSAKGRSVAELRDDFEQHAMDATYKTVTVEYLHAALMARAAERSATMGSRRGYRCVSERGRRRGRAHRVADLSGARQRPVPRSSAGRSRVRTVSARACSPSGAYGQRRSPARRP